MDKRGGVIGDLDGDDGDVDNLDGDDGDVDNLDGDNGDVDDNLLRLRCGDGDSEGDDEGGAGALINVCGSCTMNGSRSSHVLVSTSSSPN